MTDPNSKLDLDLWMDREIIPKQIKLKIQFWDILSQVGNSFDPHYFLQFDENAKGAKLSRGNDLRSFPYQVLDLIRIFEPGNELNIRVLNWFGHGLFIFILVGKNRSKPFNQKIAGENYHFCLATKPWSYPEIILDRQWTNEPNESQLGTNTFSQYFKEIPITSDQLAIKDILITELKKVLVLLK